MRLEYYHRRKELLLQKLRREQKMLSNKARFVEEVCSGDLVVSNRKRSAILADLQERGFDLLEKENQTTPDDAESDVDANDTATDAELAKGYEYLLGMKIWSLTFEKAEALRAQLAEKTQAVADLEETAPSQIWLDDLDAIEEALLERDEDMKAAEADEVKAQNKNKKHQVKKAKKAAAAKRGKKKKDDWDSDLEGDSSDDNAPMDSDDDEDFPPKKKTAGTKRQAAAPKPRKVVKKEAEASIPSSFASAPKPKAAAKRASSSSSENSTSEGRRIKLG